MSGFLSGRTSLTSVATENLEDGAVTTAKIADINVSTGKVADDAVTLAKMAPGTDGNLITYDASGNPAAVATGSATNILTSNGAGAAPTFQAAAAGGAWTLIGTSVASSSANLTVTGLDTSTYESFAIRITNLVAASEASFWIRLGDSSGIDSGASDYNWVGLKQRAGSTAVAANGSQAASSIIADAGMGTGTGENLSCTMWLSAAAATDYPNLTYHVLNYSSTPDSQNVVGGGTRSAAIDVTQIQVLASTGNLASGRMTVWGVSHA